MGTGYQLPEEYTNLGFHISKFGGSCFALKYHDHTIFVFGSDSDFGDGFIDRLCESYTSLTSYASLAGIRLD